MSNIEFFNLYNGQSAIVRILSTSVDKIERIGLHRIKFKDGVTKKTVRCLDDDCPICKNMSRIGSLSNERSDRLAVHIWDYTDNKEKVWNRTTNENFVSLLRDIENNWGNLCDCVVKISRDGLEFPKYSVAVQNPNKYPFPSEISKEDVDKNVGYRCCTYRSADELEEFIVTGILPDHVKKQQAQEWIPKDQWIKMKNAEKNKEAPTNTETKKENVDDSGIYDDDIVDPF